MGSERASEDRWWVIHESEIRRALSDAYDGTDPDVVLLELFANSTETHEPPGSL